MIARSAWGMTISRPPASAMRRAAAASSTVPAPISARSPNAAASAAMLASGCGEFSGTSIARNPASRSAWPIATASPGRTPRRISISGSVAKCARSAFIGSGPPRARS
jgi:hypothetical protein